MGIEFTVSLHLLIETQTKKITFYKSQGLNLKSPLKKSSFDRASRDFLNPEKYVRRMQFHLFSFSYFKIHISFGMNHYAIGLLCVLFCHGAPYRIPSNGYCCEHIFRLLRIYCDLCMLKSNVPGQK